MAMRVMPTAEDREKEKEFRERWNAVTEARKEVHLLYQPLIEAIAELIEEVNPDGEPWKCPKFEAVAKEFNRLFKGGRGDNNQ